MLEEEFLLEDRLQKIRQIAKDYDLENKSYIAFSGGKDSCVLSYLFDLALPNNRIPRVYVNTGIDYNAVVEHVKWLATDDSRIKIITPNVNITKMLKEYGYPFKSKEFSHKANLLSKGSMAPSVQNYFYPETDATRRYACPKAIRPYILDIINLGVSDKCCDFLKKKPCAHWAKTYGRKIAITGIRKAEGGQRNNKESCISFKNGKIKSFAPLLPMSDEWVDWFVKEKKISIPFLYYRPYNFKRTGCKGCPFNQNLAEDLAKMADLLRKDFAVAQNIFGPVYELYRKIKLRL